MKELILNKNSWHYKLCRFKHSLCFEYFEDINNLCDYIRELCISIFVLLLFFIIGSLILYLIGVAPISLLFNINYTNITDMNDIIITSLILDFIIIGMFLFSFLTKKEVDNKIKQRFNFKIKSTYKKDIYLIYAYKALNENINVKIEF